MPRVATYSGRISVLFLDDSQTRHDFLCFKKHKIRWQFHECQSLYYTVHHVYTAQDAISCLQRNQYDIISLDHDLTINHPELSNGKVVVEAILKITPKIDSQIFIHSWNSSNSKVMYNHLKEHDYDVTISPFFVA